ncbi:MAG: glycosyltransferase [Halioglobus sp.]
MHHKALQDLGEQLDNYAINRNGVFKFVINSIVKSVLPTRFLSRVTLQKRSTTLLVLHPTSEHKKRAALFISKLAKDIEVTEHILDSVATIYAKRLLFPSAEKEKVLLPRRWTLQLCYASWLIETYSPNIVITFMDDNFLTPFLRRSLNRKNGQLVNIAHSFSWPNINYSMLDVDWNLVFGKSSYRNIIDNECAFGNGELLPLGSIYISEMSATPGVSQANTASRHSVLWLTQKKTGTSSIDNLVARDIRIFLLWSHQPVNCDIGVRPHPADKYYINKYFRKQGEKVHILQQEEALNVQMRRYDIVVSSFSSGLLEAAIMGKPIVCFEHGELSRALELEKFGLFTVSTMPELEAAIIEITSNYDHYSMQSKKLANWHFENVDCAIDKYVEFLKGLLAKSEIGGNNFN